MNHSFLESIFNTYRDKVYGFFISSLGNRELAMDLTQDLFFKLCKKGDSLYEVRDINAYIFWMAQNMVVDHLRRAAHEKQYREQLIAAWKNSNITSYSQKPEVHDRINNEYFDKLFDQLVEDLTPQQKLIVTLSKKQGLSNSHIANKLGLSPNTVKNHLHQALKILRTKMSSNVDLGIIALVFFLI